MPFHKATQEDINKLKSITLANPKMEPETRELIEAFKTLTLDDPSSYLVIEVPADKERSKVSGNWSNKLKTYLSPEEFAQAKLSSPTENRLVIALRRMTDAKKKQN